jgi:hypothetical protein
MYKFIQKFQHNLKQPFTAMQIKHRLYLKVVPFIPIIACIDVFVHIIVLFLFILISCGEPTSFEKNIL